MADPGSVADAVARDIKVIAVRAPELASSGLAAAALALARLIDDPKNSATSKASCASELRGVLDRLRELTPPEEEGDRLDDLSARREKRRASA